MEKFIAGKSIELWRQELPLLESVERAEEVFWINPVLSAPAGRSISPELGADDIEDAEKRLKRFAPYLAKVYPETAVAGGLIESELRLIPAMKAALERLGDLVIPGDIYLKLDSHLPISGSVKARGGIYEALKTAEDIALGKGLLSESQDYAVLAEPRFRDFFSGYSVAVGSTGNLGLSVGIMSACLGFKVTVHMSADAKAWKKKLLRQKGAVVVEHNSDYGLAVKAGREESARDPKSHFVDDENSPALFLGYAVAAERLKNQLDEKGIAVDKEHPLMVYLPCGVGGAPGGITFGLRTVFGEAAHCFFAEPTHSPAMLLGLMTGRHNEVSVQDFGLDNRTEADGLAVGRPSGFVGRTLERDISGVFTVADDHLHRLLKILADVENIRLEPSALAGFAGPAGLLTSQGGREYINKYLNGNRLNQATHILWATGGGMVPPAIMDEFYAKGAALSQK